MPRHRVVDVSGELDEAVDEVELTRPPGQVVRVDRDAVAADAGPRRELHEPERLGCRGGDDLPDVDAHPLAQQSELVDEGDVHVTEDVLEDLGQLRSVGRRQLDHVLLIRRRRAAARAVASGVVAPTSRGHVLGGAGRIARVDPLGREREVEVPAGDQAALLEDLAERTGRRAGERRRLEDDQLAFPEVPADELGGRQDRPEVRVLGLVDRGRDADEDDVGLGELGGVGPDEPETRRQRAAQAIVRDVVDRRSAGAQLGDPTRVGIDALDLEPRLDERDGKREPDVAQADHGQATVFVHGSSSPVTGVAGSRARRRGRGRRGAAHGERIPGLARADRRPRVSRPPRVPPASVRRSPRSGRRPTRPTAAGVAWASARDPSRMAAGRPATTSSGLDEPVRAMADRDRPLGVRPDA